jgi:hypothetical protein
LITNLWIAEFATLRVAQPAAIGAAMSDTVDTLPEDPFDAIVDAPFDAALSERYLIYAMSTITARSLPDLRDGLKPVHPAAVVGDAVA